MAHRISLWLFIATAICIAGFNAYWVVRGVATGAVPTLHKFSHATIQQAIDPGSFALNLLLRSLIALLAGGWTIWLAAERGNRGRRGD